MTTRKRRDNQAAQYDEALILELETKAFDLADEYNAEGLTVDQVIGAVKVGLTAFVRTLEERKN